MLATIKIIAETTNITINTTYESTVRSLYINTKQPPQKSNQTVYDWLLEMEVDECLSA